MKADQRKRILIIFVLCFLFFLKNSQAAEAVVIANQITKERYSYNGIEVKYMVNNQRIAETLPGIIADDGSALGPCKEIFEEALGVSFSILEEDKSFLLRSGLITIKMTFESKIAYVNEKKVTLDAAPLLISLDYASEKLVYVPTRFVSETFGFTYQWNSKTATSSIEKPNLFYDGNTVIQYTDVMPVLLINEKKSTNKDYPGLLFDNEVFFSARSVFQDTGLAEYIYQDENGLLLLKANGNTVLLVLESPVAYINEKPVVLPSVPRMITPKDSKKAELYIPIIFTAKALGFSAEYQKGLNQVQINGSNTALDQKKQESSNATDIKDLSQVMLDTSGLNRIFSIIPEPGKESLVQKNSEAYYPTEVTAFECKNSDAIFLKGISQKDIRIEDLGNIINIEITSCQNPYESFFFFEPDYRFLNYCFLNSSLNKFSIKMIKQTEIQYYTYDTVFGSVIHFTNENGLFVDRIEEVKKENNTSDTTKVLTETASLLLPSAVFSRKTFAISLPAGIQEKDITSSDEYQEKKIIFSIKGNQTSFLKAQTSYKKADNIQSVSFTYNKTTNTTQITIQTTKIMGFSYSVKDGVLGVKLGTPKEIYKKVIILDAGHGGIDPGTSRKNVKEKDVNFNVINLYAPEYFKDSEIKVYYTRTDDTKISLERRAAFASEVGADFFISFHVNANNSSSVSGTNVYYSLSNNQITDSGLRSSLLAQSLQTKISKAWGTRDRGIITAKFDVIHKNTVPAVLIECAFITNDSDFEKIKSTSYQKKAAKAIFDSVQEIYKKYTFR